MRESAARFLELYAETLDKGKALEGSGVTARELRKMTEPRFIDYDQDFTDGYLEVEERLKVEMVGVAKGVALSNSRQKLSAAKWLAGEVDREVDRVEKAHIRFLEDKARERALAGGPKEVGGGNGGTLSIEEMKSGGGSFARATE